MRKLLIVAFAAMLIAPAFAATSASVELTGTVTNYVAIELADGQAASIAGNWNPALASEGTVSFSRTNNCVADLDADLTGDPVTDSANWDAAIEFGAGPAGPADDIHDDLDDVAVGEDVAVDVTYYILPHGAVAGSKSATITVTIAISP